MINREAAIIVTIAAIMILIPVTYFPLIRAQDVSHCEPGTAYYWIPPRSDGGLAVSGANIYAAWTCYNHVLFTKSNDGGKTFANTTLMSAPNTNPKIHVLNDNVSISASGNNVAVMWDTNNTGISNPVLRTSSGGGNSFSNIVTLNSTPGGINKPAGSNMTTVSNMTGAAGNTTAAALSSIPTTHPAGTAPDNKVHQVPTNHCVTFGCLHQKGTSPSP